MFDLILPFPPTVNNYYVKTQRGVFISQKGRFYRKNVSDSVIEQLPEVHIEEKIHLSVILYPPDNRKRDLDNYMKAMLDALTQCGFWTDDSLIDQLIIYRGEVLKSDACAYLRVAEAGPLLPNHLNTDIDTFLGE